MDWKNQLTKTPYLVLFIVLISIGVGTASALITITLSGNVNITGDADVDGNLNVDGDISGPTIDDISPIGTRDIFFSAEEIIPSLELGAGNATTFDLGITVFRAISFDQSTPESASINWVPPRNYDGGTVRATFYWTATSGTSTDTVDWMISGLAISDGDSMNAGTGDEVITSDALMSALDLHISPESSAITIFGNPADADLIVFTITRDIIIDDLDADANLIGVMIEYSIDAATTGG